jgi:thiamine biosynthesis lipoprotein
MMGRALFLLFLFFCACEAPNSRRLTYFSGMAMTMEWRAQFGDTVRNPEEVERIIERSFREINQLYNHWNPQSELSLLNRLPAHVTREISPELADFLAFTQQFVTLSEGRFDPTVMPMQTLWKHKLLKNERPTEFEIATLFPAIGWNRLNLQGRSFSKSHSETALDLGGIAKGYAVDLIVDRLQAAGYANVYFEWGGEIRAIGQHPEGRPWIVWIARLKSHDPKDAVDLVKLEGEGIATSGDYEQFWVLRNPDGTETTYFHVVDPRTGFPLVSRKGSIASVSVVAPTCAIADALATCCMLFSTQEEAEAWALKAQTVFPTAKFWFVKRE